MTTTTINTTYFNKTQWNALHRIAPTNNMSYTNHMKGVHFTNDYIVATDGHKAVFIMGDYSENSGITLDNNYNKINSEKPYPNMDRILTHNFESETSNQFKVNVNDFIKTHKEVLQALNGYKNDNSEVFMDVLENEKVNVYDIKKTVCFEIETAFKTWRYDECKKVHNCTYLIDIMNVFKAFKHKEVVIDYSGKMRPTIIRSLDDTIKALIMPIRVY